MRAKVLDIKKLDKKMGLQGAVLAGIKWLDPKKAPFVVSGLAWFKKEKLYRRLPVKPEWKVREGVDLLADCPAGAQLRFRTDSKRVAIRVLLTEAQRHEHMTATGQAGFDCYIGRPGKTLYISTTRFDQTKLAYEYRFFETDKKEMKSITLNFPLYQGVKDLIIGLDKSSKVLPPLPYKNKKKIIVYGTSTTQGGCASRPGMLFTNILSRRINLEFINLGFSGNGLGEPELARLISEIERPACFVLDFEANSGCMYAKNLPQFIRILRSYHAKIPILIISRMKFSPETLGQETGVRLLRFKFTKDTVAGFKARGEKNLYLLDGSKLLGKDYDECTVDGVHPTDLGFWRIAAVLTPVLKKILK